MAFRSQTAFPKQEDVPDVVHAFAEHRPSHPGDMQLREAGWRIYARPKAGEALWAKGGEIAGEAEARRRIGAPT